MNTVGFFKKMLRIEKQRNRGNDLFHVGYTYNILCIYIIIYNIHMRYITKSMIFGRVRKLGIHRIQMDPNGNFGSEVMRNRIGIGLLKSMTTLQYIILYNLVLTMILV